jgi:tetratricopeptide (TPR) repeat protein
MSNNFPKVSPDGRWIVWVQNRNGLLMRPDSELYIVPFKGGRARRLRANTSRMNSWHSFSPNGHWLVFSSKGRSLYTQLYLTHIDKDGNDSPAIRIENATAANRAVNIPEFANIPPGGLEGMDAPAVEFYRLFDVAAELARKGEYPAAIGVWRKAVDLDPADAKARFNLGLSLQQSGQIDESISQYRKAVEINPENAPAYTNLGFALAQTGKQDEAIEQYEKSLSVDPRNAKAQSNLGAALIEKGRVAEGIEHCRKALEADPEDAEAHNSVGIALARTGQLDEAVPHLEKAVSLEAGSPEYQYNLGRILAASGKFAQALPHFEEAVKISGEQDPLSMDMLAAMYSEVGRFPEAVATARRALDLAVRQNNYDLVQALRGKLARYQGQAEGR